MQDLLKTVFGNPMPARALRKARRTFDSYARRFKFMPDQRPPLAVEPLPGAWEYFGIRQLVPDANAASSRRADASSRGAEVPSADTPLEMPGRDRNSVVLGTIRMGYGHYRIALAIASAARSLGLTPYWLDFLSFPESAATKVLNYLNDLYSFGSRLSQRFRLFNHYVWEKITFDSGRHLTSCPRDRELSRIFAPILGALDRSVPFIATHPWTGHAAVLNQTERVVEVVPDNFPLAFHLVEGAVHAVQTPFAYLGYRSLYKMGGSRRAPLEPMPDEAIKYTGHFVDHEIVQNIEADTEERFQRLRDNSARRLLLTMGGAGAQRRRMFEIISYCAPAVAEHRATLFVNMGDHGDQWLELKRDLDGARIPYTLHQDWQETQEFAAAAHESEVEGIHVFVFAEIFPAVYATNLLMRASDVLVTKPSELSFYPVPKLFIQRVGRHEAWGAIRGADIGDGSLETDSLSGVQQMLKLILSDTGLLRFFGQNILNNHRIGVYNGAYQAVRLAVGAASLV